MTEDINPHPADGGDYSTNATGGVDGFDRRNPYCTVLEALLCPSDGVRRVGTATLAATNYRVLRADVPTVTTNISGSTTVPTNNQRAFFTHSTHGLRNIGSIRDGTSNTLMLSEAALSRSTADPITDVKGGVANISIQDTDSANLATCRSQKGSGPSFTTATGAGRLFGARWADGQGNVYSGFNAVLPPNSPTCGSNQEYAGLVSASSYHTGGVNVVLADASGKFVSDSVSALTNPLPAGRTDPFATGANGAPGQSYDGPSLFGIWGAYGSINRSESGGIL